MTNPTIQTRSSKMASNVLDTIKKRTWERSKAEELKLIKEYGNLAAALPALIRSAGLAQAIAYVETRASKKGQQALYDDLCTALGWENPPTAIIVGWDLDQYIYETRQTLEALLWFKRFSQSVMGFDPVKDLADVNDEVPQ